MAWGQIGNIKGPAGATGSTGAQGPQGPAGIGFTWRGKWSGSTAYAVNDCVQRTNQSYICTVAGTGFDPATDTTHWNLMAAQGATGATGSQGPQGNPGATGATGSQGPPGPNAVSADSGNIATLGTDSLVLVPQSQIWNVRLRSFNAFGNSSTECDQALNGSVSTNAARICDRWLYNKVFATGVCPAQRISSGAMGGGQILVPGTNFTISNSFIRFTLTTPQSLAAGDVLALLAYPEGAAFRELQNDVHSLQVLVRSSVAGITFGIALRDPGATRSLTKLGTIPTANTWTLVTFPNLP